MGTGARYERAALGQATGQAKAIQAHEKAMIPIWEAQVESELKLQEKEFEQEIQQAEKIYLMADRLLGKKEPAQPVYVTSQEKPTNYTLYIILGIGALFLLKGKK